MKIAIDATTLLINRAGVTSYLTGLVAGIKRRSDTEVSLLNFGKSRDQQGVLERKLTTLYRDLIWQPYTLPVRASNAKADILFSPSHIIAKEASIPRFVTFHDFYILRCPQSFTKWHSMFSGWQYPKVLESEPHLITISEFTKSELYHFFPKFKGSVEVIYNGISDDWKQVNDDAIRSVLKKYALPTEFIFSVGSLEPRKNFITLFKVLLQAPNGQFPPLVLVMPDAWQSQSDAAVIQQLVEERKLYILRNVERSELIGLYNKAICLIYPSLYEGFGMPPMEAMACGCPVITSNNSALQEIYSGSALLVDPLNIEELSDAINTILTQNALRLELIQKGFLLSRQYTYSTMAEKTIQYFKRYAR